MSFDLQSVAIDAKKLRDGVIWKVHREPDGSLAGSFVDAPVAGHGCLLVFPMGTAYHRAREEAEREHLPTLRDREVSEDDKERIRRKIEAKALAKSVLRGWWNISIGGAPVEWSEDKAAELLAEERWMSLRDFVVLASQHRASLLEQEEEQAAGN